MPFVEGILIPLNEMRKGKLFTPTAWRQGRSTGTLSLFAFRERREELVKPSCQR